MSKKQIVMVQISDLKVNLFVREKLNEDHVLYLAEMIESGVTLSPIEITPDNTLVDGRHRIEAYSLLGITELNALVREDLLRESEIIAAAYQANIGGALPPTRSDVEHTVTMLFQRKESIKNIADMLGFPASIVRKYVTLIKSKLARQLLARAAAAVTEGGLNVAQAAEAHGADLEKLKEHLSGRRKKNEGGNLILENERNLTHLYRSIGAVKAQIMRKFFQKHQDGDVSEKQVRRIISKIRGLDEQSARRLSDWEQRLNNLCAGLSPPEK